MNNKEKSVGNVKRYIKIDIVKNLEEVKDLEVNYNSNYFLDGVQKMDGGELSINFTTINRPMFIKSNKDNTFTYLLMPLNR